MLRVVLIGAESTGKSTLIKALAAYFNAPFSNEFARDYVTKYQAAVTEDDLERIILGQIAYEKNACKKASPLVFHDTNLLSTSIYSRYYFRSFPESLQRALNLNHYNLYLFCLNDIPWIAEPLQRDSPDGQKQIQDLIYRALIKDSLPFVNIKGSLDKRIRESIKAIEKLLSSTENQEFNA